MAKVVFLIAFFFFGTSFAADISINPPKVDTNCIINAVKKEFSPEELKNMENLKKKGAPMPEAYLRRADKAIQPCLSVK